MRAVLLRAAVYTTLLYISWCAAGYFYWQDKMLFPTDVVPKPGNSLYSTETVSIRLTAQNGDRIEAWYIPVIDAVSTRGSPLVVFCHGNGEIIDHQTDVIERYRRLGCSVLLPEFRGYGRSEGKPSEKAIVADVVQFYDETMERVDIDKSRVVIHGRSLGAAVAAQLAARRGPAVLILESAFVSVEEMARKQFLPSFLVKNPFRTDLVVSHLGIPLLILHGARDTVIPVEHGRRLRDLAPTATYVELDSGHMVTARTHAQRYWTEIEKFLVRTGIARPEAR